MIGSIVLATSIIIIAVTTPIPIAIMAMVISSIM